MSGPGVPRNRRTPLCSAAAGSQGLATGRDRTVCDQVWPHKLLRWAPAGTVLGGGGKAHGRLASCNVPTHGDGATPEASAAALNAGRSFSTFPPPISVAGLFRSFMKRPQEPALCQAGDLSPSCLRADTCVSSRLGPRHAGQWVGQEQGGLLGGGDAAP